MAGRLLWGSCLALGIVFTEVLRAHRESQWAGDSLGAFVGLVAGFAFYLVLIVGVGVVFEGFARKRIPFEVRRIALAFTTAGVLVWSIVAGLSGGGWKGVVFGYAVVLATGGAMALSSPTRRDVAALLALTWTSAVAAVCIGGDRLFLLEGRATLVALVGLAWAGGALVSAGLVGLGRRRHGMAWGGRGLALMCVAGSILLAVWPRPEAAVTRSPERPNVILIVSDTLRADVLGAYGGMARTPNLDALAEGGTRFARAYSLAPWTPPSMSGLLTSTYPPGLSAEPGPGRERWEDEIWRYRMAPDGVTIAEAFRRAGYETVAVVSNPMVWSLPGFARGFDAVFRSHPVEFVRPAAWSLLPYLHGALARVAPGLAPVRFNDSTRAVGRYARRWIDERAGDQPFFLYVHFMDPHAPYDPPEGYRSASVSWRLFWPFPSRWDWGCPQGGRAVQLDAAGQAKARALYEGEAAYVDEAVGRVLDALDRRGLRGRTVVSFTADHGEELWDHGLWEHGHTLYEELIHVPWIVAGPGVAAQTVAAPVSAIDLAPTLAGVAGLAMPDTWRGRPRDKGVTGTGPFAPDEAVFVHGTSHRVAEEPLEAVIKGDWKLIRGVRTGSARLFNLAEDPGETRDLSRERPEVREDLNARLDAWLDSFESTFSSEGEAKPGTREEMLEEMRAVGYLQ